MIEASPDLESRVERSLLNVLKDAFPGVGVFSFSSPGERSGKCIGVRVESGSENPIGTNIFDVSIEVESQNLSDVERKLLGDMLGNSYSAKETITNNGLGQFSMPSGQPVEMIGAPRTVEGEHDRIVTYSLAASIQPI